MYSSVCCVTVRFIAKPRGSAVNELDQVTRNGYDTTRRLNEEVAAGLRRRSNRRTIDLLDETQRENEKLLRERHELKRQNELAVELVRTWLNRSEAFRRLAIHLRDAWQPINPDELPLKSDLDPLLHAKWQEWVNDPNFVKHREAEIARSFAPANAAAKR